jgi:alpha-D-xyloside xylohydrolase
LPSFIPSPDRLEWRHGHHVLTVEPWGRDSVRVRAGLHRIQPALPGALTSSAPSTKSWQVDLAEDHARLVNGLLTVRVDTADGLLTATRADTGTELLREQPAHAWWPGARHFDAATENLHRIEQRFAAYEDEKIYGLGQHGHGRFDQKGMVLELLQRNGEVSIPFAVSSRGYGFLWNNPAVGRVEFAANGTRWVAERARQIDYWLTTAETPAGVMAHYADATGHAPTFPSWASGLWQSKLRYRDQEELLDVAHEYKRRGLPLSVLVIDYLHWKHLGDWDFDRRDWPDPSAMVAELRGDGIETVVSVWPTLSPLSANYAVLRDSGHLVGAGNGDLLHAGWPDTAEPDVEIGVAFYDATDTGARDALWKQLYQHYYQVGIRTFWLDACEPEMKPTLPHHLDYSLGSGTEVANLYPREHVRGIYEHLRNEGEDSALSLVRSAWAGSQRYGAALWSGDIPATFGALAASVRAGLNVAMSGIPWWTTDIGGFDGGDPQDEAFRELVVRWFQFSAFCPILRMHGFRLPHSFSGIVGVDGGPNELWAYGPEAESAMTLALRLRERLRPYLHEHLRSGQRTGLPLLRPLLLEFPDDQLSWTVEDQFMFGPDLLVAPVTEQGARAREVYLPDGADWTRHQPNGSLVRYAGGSRVTADVPLAATAVFVRDDAVLPIAEPDLSCQVRPH